MQQVITVYKDLLSTGSMHQIPCIRLCRLFYKFGRQHNALLRQWYGVGVAVAAMLALSVVFMLGQDVWLAFSWIREVLSCKHSNEATC